MKRKLAAFGLAFSLAQLAAAYLPSLAVWLATAFSFVFAGLTALQKRKLTPVVLLTVAACLGFAAHLVYEPLAVQPVLELAGRQVRVVATAGTDSETSYREDRLRGTLHITELDGEPADLLVTCASFPGSRPGEIFSATLELHNLDEDSYRMNYFSDGVFLQAEYVGEYAYLGESTTLEFILYRIRQELSRRLMTWLPTEEGGVEAAMLIGDTSRLSELQEENFRTAGVSHLLAVSGLHVTLLCGLLVSSRENRRRFSRPLIVMQAILLLFYLALIGFPVSAVRAGIGCLIALGGYYFLQPPDTLTSMGLAAILLGLFNAYFPCDLGFQLSFSAVLGVEVAASLSRRARRKWKEPEDSLKNKAYTAFFWLADSVLIAVFAALATMPVLLAHGMSVSGVGVLTNLLVVWMLAPALVLGLLVLLLSAVPFLDFAMRGASLILAAWLHWMTEIIGRCAALPGARLALPVKYTLFVLAVLGLLAFIFWRAKRLCWYIPAAAACAAAAIFLGIQLSKNVVHMAAVGTAGNPCLVITQDGYATVLFRGGNSNLNAVEEYLKETGNPPVALVVDLRQDPREMEFDADRVISMDQMSSDVQTVSLPGGIQLELLHDSGGNLAVVTVDGYTVGMMAGRVRRDQPVELNVYVAGSSYPDVVDADTVVYTSHTTDWLEEVDPEQTTLLYGMEEPVLTIRPGRSATFDGVKPYAVQ